VGGVGGQRLRHINDSVLSSLKMEGILFFIFASDLQKANLLIANPLINLLF
jgi:hypothetical protein